MALGSTSGRAAAARRRRPLRIEPLEHRRMLAAGLLQLNTTVPISQRGQPNVQGTVLIAADIVLLDPAAPAAFSVTATSAAASGTIDGQIDLGTGFLQGIDGTFITDPLPPSVQISRISPTQLQIVAQQTGTITVVLQLFGQQTGSFTTSIDAILDLQSGVLSGTVDLVLQGDGLDDHRTVAFTETDTLPAGFAVPDATQASLADRVFHDANADGMFSGDEAGVGDVRVRLFHQVGGTQTLAETTTTDADGFYSFYNLDAGDYVVQFDRLAPHYDITRATAGTDRSADSDVSSRTGRTGVLTLAGGAHRRDIDAGLRTVQRQWQNPNERADVDDDGTVQALDALHIINRLNQRDGNDSLPADRPLGSLFYDADGSGDVTAADALRVIHFLNRRGRSGEGESGVRPQHPAPGFGMLLPSLLDEEQRRRRGLS